MRWSILIVLALAACDNKPSKAPGPDPEKTKVAADECVICGPKQQCVQSFDGSCKLKTTCVARLPEGDREVDCATNKCDPACEKAYCVEPYQCKTRPSCGTESPKAFTCYGP